MIYQTQQHTHDDACTVARFECVQIDQQQQTKKIK